MGPDPLTRTERPVRSPARATACSATPKGSARAAAFVETPSGTTRSWSGRTGRRRENPPCSWGVNAAEPKYLTSGHRFVRSASSRASCGRPTRVAGWMVTRVPTRTPRFSAASAASDPICTTCPATSWPRMRGSWSTAVPELPFFQYETSEPQIPPHSISTRTSAGPATGSGTSSTRRSSLPCTTTAFMSLSFLFSRWGSSQPIEMPRRSSSESRPTAKTAIEEMTR